MVELKFENETNATRAIQILEVKGIKSSQSSLGKDKILIPEHKLEDAKTILKS
jgi:hypothetical protein